MICFKWLAAVVKPA